MLDKTILVIGAGGQIGVDLTLALRKIHGNANVIATDLRPANKWLDDSGPYAQLDVMNKYTLWDVIRGHQVKEVYLLAAMLSATAEQQPRQAWDLNMQSLLQLLEIARQQNLKLFWPSSIAVFGDSSPKQDCPQQTIMEPATVYGISKYAGECWCQYYHHKYGVDVRSLRYPGLISWRSAPGGGTTDYAVDIFHKAITQRSYNCFLEKNTMLPMMYMPDAIRATLEIMEAPAEKIKMRNSYNIAATSFSPQDIAKEIRKYFPGFTINYQPDTRQSIADTWPQTIDDSAARKDWGWKHEFDLSTITADMLGQLQKVMQTPAYSSPLIA